MERAKRGDEESVDNIWVALVEREANPGSNGNGRKLAHVCHCEKR